MRLSLVIGRSGSGKTSSLRYVNPETTAIIVPNNKELFPGFNKVYVEKKNKITTNEINHIDGVLTIFAKNPAIKLIIIEDLNHFFNARINSMAFRARNSGGEVFARWNDFGGDVAEHLVTAISRNTSNVDVFVFAHTDIKEDGHIGMKTSGKLLDNTIDIPSYVDCLFHSVVIEEAGVTKYKFLTNTDGIHLAKTPAGMFPEKYIPNDLKFILERMEKYRKGEIKPAWID